MNDSSIFPQGHEHPITPPAIDKKFNKKYIMFFSLGALISLLIFVPFFMLLKPFTPGITDQHIPAPNNTAEAVVLYDQANSNAEEFWLRSVSDGKVTYPCAKTANDARSLVPGAESAVVVLRHNLFYEIIKPISQEGEQPLVKIFACYAVEDIQQASVGETAKQKIARLNFVTEDDYTYYFDLIYLFYQARVVGSDLFWDIPAGTILSRVANYNSGLLTIRDTIISNDTCDNCDVGRSLDQVPTLVYTYTFDPATKEVYVEIARL